MVNNVSYDSQIKSNSGIVYYGSSSDSTNSDGHAAGYLEVDPKSFDFCFDTEEVEKLILENQGEELSIFLNPSVFRKIVRERVLTWKDPVNDLVEFSTRNLKITIAECIDYSIGVYKFKSFITNTLNERIEQLEKIMEEKIAEIFDQEIDCYTLNHYLNNIIDKLRYEPLKKALEAVSLDTNGQKLVPIHSIHSILESFGSSSKLPNEKRQALEMMIYLAAYIKVSKKRVIDSFPMVIHNVLLTPMKKVHEEFESVDDEKLKSLLREPPQIENRRHQLSVQMDALRLAQKELDSF